VNIGIGSNVITVEIENLKKSVYADLLDDTLPPRTPTGVSAYSAGSGAVVSWNPLIEAASYNIYYAASPEVTKSNYSTLPGGAQVIGASSPQTITGLSPGTVYYFVVTGENFNGEGDESIEVMTSEPSAPTNISAQTIDLGAIISWDALIDPTTYNIYYATSPGVTKSNYSTLPNGAKLVGASSPQTITGLTIGAVHYFVVTGMNSVGEGDESIEVMTSEPDAPTGVSARATGTDAIISWNPVIDSTSYNIYYASSPGVNKLNYSTLPDGGKLIGASSPQSITGLINEDYYFVVTAANAVGESKESLEVTARLEPTLSFDIKTFRFAWPIVSNATHYKLLENPDGNSGFSQVGSDFPQGTQTFDHSVSLFKRVNASYILQSCVGVDCDDYGFFNITDNLVDAIGYFKTHTISYRGQDFFGRSVSLGGWRAYGDYLAVGAPGEDSNATGINGDDINDLASDSGAVYIFKRVTYWFERAYIKASNTDSLDGFGRSVSLSGDGGTLAVGATGEDSNANGIDGNQADNSASDSGAVYVFSRSGIYWPQQAYIKASNADSGDSFGGSISLSGDGNTLAVGALYEGSNATGIDGNQTDNSASISGAVYVFTRSGSTWAQQAYVKASNTDSLDGFGRSVSLSDDGNILAVGASAEDSNATGIDGNQADNSVSGSGAVYVFTRNGSTWAQQAYVKASDTDSSDAFGTSLSLSGDGNTLAVGATGEDSSTSGINSAPDDLASLSGAVYVFTRSGSTWAQQAYVKASNTDSDDYFGTSLSLSDDGNILAVSASTEASNATGIDGNQFDNSEYRSGAAYVFTRNGSTWAQQSYVKASNTDSYDRFGKSLSLSGDGNTLSVGANWEDSNATGIDGLNFQGDQADNSEANSGAVYLY
jgi:hypothetical protein